MVIYSSFEHTEKQIATFCGEWLKEALLPMPPGQTSEFESMPIERQSLSFIIQHDSMGLHRRTQMGEADTRCQPLAISLHLSPLCVHISICTPSNIDSLCSLWQDQAVCFCGVTTPSYLSVITLEMSDPTNKRGP